MAWIMWRAYSSIFLKIRFLIAFFPIFFFLGFKKRRFHDGVFFAFFFCCCVFIRHSQKRRFFGFFLRFFLAFSKKAFFCLAFFLASFHFSKGVFFGVVFGVFFQKRRFLKKPPSLLPLPQGAPLKTNLCWGRVGGDRDYTFWNIGRAGEGWFPLFSKWEIT